MKSQGDNAMISRVRNFPRPNAACVLDHAENPLNIINSLSCACWTKRQTESKLSTQMLKSLRMTFGCRQLELTLTKTWNFWFGHVMVRLNRWALENVTAWSCQKKRFTFTIMKFLWRQCIYWAGRIQIWKRLTEHNFTFQNELKDKKQ